VVVVVVVVIRVNVQLPRARGQCAPLPRDRPHRTTRARLSRL